MPRLIALDWGTTSLRAYLLGTGGRVLEERAESWGVMQLPAGGFEGALEGVAGNWRAQWPSTPVIACGMVGSAQGWVTAPYVPSPAGIDELAAALVTTPDDLIHIVPGVSRGGDRPDVMRGEETQAVGVAALHPDLADARIVLPGTHSKWVRLSGGHIDDLATYLTGELYAVLRDHSILGRPARDARGEIHPAAASTAFVEGVRAARDSQGGLASLLFSVRARVLVGDLSGAESLEYLSGLLLGDEIRAAVEATYGTAPLALAGDAALCARYASALGRFGLPTPRIVTQAAPAGMWCIAAVAGLLGAPTPQPV